MNNRGGSRTNRYPAICDVCGFKYDASELRRRWDGAMVCSYDYEPRHPQDFVRGIKENVTPPFTRPAQTDVYRSVGDLDSLALNARLINQFALG